MKRCKVITQNSVHMQRDFSDWIDIVQSDGKELKIITQTQTQCSQSYYITVIIIYEILGL